MTENMFSTVHSSAAVSRFHSPVQWEYCLSLSHLESPPAVPAPTTHSLHYTLHPYCASTYLHVFGVHKELACKGASLSQISGTWLQMMKPSPAAAGEQSKDQSCITLRYRVVLSITVQSGKAINPVQCCLAPAESRDRGGEVA